MNLENMMLSKQRLTRTNILILFIWSIWKKRTLHRLPWAEKSGEWGS
jgi:hypothetical protein